MHRPCKPKCFMQRRLFLQLRCPDTVPQGCFEQEKLIFSWFGGGESRIEVLAGSVSLEAFLLGLQMRPFPLSSCDHPLCESVFSFPLPVRTLVRLD